MWASLLEKASKYQYRWHKKFAFALVVSPICPWLQEKGEDCESPLHRKTTQHAQSVNSILVKIKVNKECIEVITQYSYFGRYCFHCWLLIHTNMKEIELKIILFFPGFPGWFVATLTFLLYCPQLLCH